MPRGPRIDAIGAAQHVIVRGIEGRRIFRDDVDREDFVERLGRLILELGFLCYAWALIPNHAHLVLQTGPVPLSRLMARLGTGYARRFNERHERSGHLFQNRFRSRVIEDDSDLLGVVLYVHCNPFNAGLVPGAGALEQFPWCGHGGLTGARQPYPFESRSETLALLAHDPQEAIHQLRRRMAKATAEPLVALPAGKPDRPARVQASRGRGLPIDRLIAETCARLGIDRAELLRGRRSQRVVAARREIALKGVLEEGLSGREVARALCVSGATISRTLDLARVTGGGNADHEGNTPAPAVRWRWSSDGER
jgi:REP element-mobilizing transposase RayT